MEKLFKLSAFFLFFAGLSCGVLGGVSAQALENGLSESGCIKEKVRIAIDDGQRVWEKCIAGGADGGCRLRFCSADPFKEDGLNASWKKEDCNKYCVGFQELIPIGDKKVKSISGNSGTDLAMNYVSMIYKFGASILGILATLIIVVSGVQMIAGGADENNYTAAKDRIVQALFSLAMLFSSALILKTINPDFFT